MPLKGQRYFTQVAGSAFPLLGNLFGTLDRTRFIFRDTLQTIEALVHAKIDPKALFSDPKAFLKVPGGAFTLLPRFVGVSEAAVCANRETFHIFLGLFHGQKTAVPL